MNTIVTHYTPTLDWPAARVALDTARDTKDRYVREVWDPAEAAEGLTQTDPINVEYERLLELECVAEEVWVAAPAPDLAAAIEKIEYARDRWSEFEAWPEPWWNAVLADLRRFSGGADAVDLSTDELDAIDFGPILDSEAVATFHREHRDDRIAWLSLALGMATRSRAEMTAGMRELPTGPEGGEGECNIEAIGGMTDLREWLEDTTKIVRAVESRMFIVAEQIARERGEMEKAA